MSTSTVRGLTSIIIPCWSQLAFTMQCIAALEDHTRPAWELIVVDNGSTDGTAIYLEGVRDMAAVPVTVVSNATNLGFPAAINQGLQLARGEYLVLLNNDVVVTNGWLDQLIALASTKRDFTVEHAETNAGRESGMRRGAGASVAFREGEPPCEPSANAGSDGASPSRNHAKPFSVLTASLCQPSRVLIRNSFRNFPRGSCVLTKFLKSVNFS